MRDVGHTMAEATHLAPRYRPPSRTVVVHRAKKVCALLVYPATGAFILWLVGPGLVANLSFDLESITTIVALAAAFVVLGFLIVVTWNERLPQIEGDEMMLPFPIRRKAGSRTRRIRLGEIAEAELTVNSIGRRGARLTLADGTQLFLPEAVFGEQGREVLDAIARGATLRASPRYPGC